MAGSESAALTARTQLLSSRRKLVLARSISLTFKKSLLEKMTTAVRVESELLEKQRCALQAEEKLLEWIKRAGLKEDFTLSDEEDEDSAAGPPQPKRRRRRTDRYDDDLVEAQKEFLAKIEERNAVRAECSATDSRIDALMTEKRAFEEECKRGNALLWEFACIYMSPVRKLPVEMLRKIFSYMRPVDLVTAGQVCSAWRAVLREGTTWKDSPHKISDNDYPYDNFPRILRAAPRLGIVEASSYTEWPAPIRPVEIDLLTLRTSRDFRQGVPSVLKHYVGWIRRLRLAIYYKHTAQMIDSKATSLEELSVNFKCKRPHVFNGRFVRQSTLVTLRCWDAPAGTLASILAGHSATLQRICLRASASALPLPGSAINAALQNCPRLRTLEVECRTPGLEVPAGCSELVLVVAECRPLGCPGCAAVGDWLGLTSVTHLHLVARTSPAPPQEDPARPLRWLLGHVKQLDPRFLRALGRLSLRCPCKPEEHPEQFAQLERLTKDCRSVSIGGITTEDKLFETFSSVDSWR